MRAEKMAGRPFTDEKIFCRNGRWSRSSAHLGSFRPFLILAVCCFFLLPLAGCGLAGSCRDCLPVTRLAEPDSRLENSPVERVAGRSALEAGIEIGDARIYVTWTSNRASPGERFERPLEYEVTIEAQAETHSFLVASPERISLSFLVDEERDKVVLTGNYLSKLLIDGEVVDEVRKIHHREPSYKVFALPMNIESALDPSSKLLTFGPLVISSDQTYVDALIPDGRYLLLGSTGGYQAPRNCAGSTSRVRRGNSLILVSVDFGERCSQITKLGEGFIRPQSLMMADDGQLLAEVLVTRSFKYRTERGRIERVRDRDELINLAFAAP